MSASSAAHPAPAAPAPASQAQRPKSCARVKKFAQGIVDAILYAESSGEAEHIYSVIKEFWGDWVLPIALVKHELKAMMSQKSKHKYKTFLGFRLSLPIPGGLPEYIKRDGKLFKVDEFTSDDLTAYPRANQWDLAVDLNYWPTQANYVNVRSKFQMKASLEYLSSNYNDSIAKPLDCYDYCTREFMKKSLYIGDPGFKRVGETYHERNQRVDAYVNKLKEDKFAYELRDHIMTAVVKLKALKFCQKTKTRGRGNKVFDVKCGNPVLEGTGMCSSCCKHNFADWFRSSIKNA